MQNKNSVTFNELKQTFQKTADVAFQHFAFQNETVHILTCEAMIDERLLYELVIPELKKGIESFQNEKGDNAQQQSESQPASVQDKAQQQKQSQGQEQSGNKQSIEDMLPLPQLQKVTDIDSCISLLFSGNCLIYLTKQELLLAVNISSRPNRTPEETNIEVAISGPRDNFIEDLATNIALVRKRLPTKSLIVEKLQLGARSKTNIAIMYFDDIVDKKILTEIKQQLEKVNNDVVFSGNILMENINNGMFAFPRTDNTGRPDTVVQALSRGRLIIFVDGTAYAMILPTNFFLLLKSGEDNETSVVYSSFERFLRLLGLFLGLLLPAFWLALTTFHQNQIPLQLLATIVQANTGLPFSTALEMLIMLLFFELFREAGLRLPSVIGGTISVVGGLIIGDAAIRAGVTSPAMVVIIAISTIAGFTLVNQSLMATISLLRIAFVIITAFFGLFGFFVSLHFTLMYLSHIRVFGVPYINISADLNLKSIGKTLFRLGPKTYKKRPSMLKTKDDTRSDDEK
ncbi:spore germination protein [Lysinibacillus sp. 54212]|uniref:spore germination protein n=1 Tax=Lysinibacillus sp. 54212 TaxID=3119829 RepID=UPI002FC7E94A